LRTGGPHLTSGNCVAILDPRRERIKVRVGENPVEGIKAYRVLEVLPKSSFGGKTLEWDPVPEGGNMF